MSQLNIAFDGRSLEALFDFIAKNRDILISGKIHIKLNDLFAEIGSHGLKDFSQKVRNEIGIDISWMIDGKWHDIPNTVAHYVKRLEGLNIAYYTVHASGGGAATIARRIVDAHFPESIRDDVLAAAGLPTDLAEPSPSAEQQRRRDPSFREKVLCGYQYRCGVCGHDLRLGRQTVGLEAAHIKWFQAKGPDVVPNGIALCSLHHKVFDLGAFTVLAETYQIVFSQHLNGNEEPAGRFLAYQGAGLILPRAREYFPQTAFLDWHRKEVFKNPARE